jgi:hypothetical protein
MSLGVIGWRRVQRRGVFGGAKMRPRSLLCYDLWTWMFMLVNSGTHHFGLARATLANHASPARRLASPRHHRIMNRNPSTLDRLLGIVAE